MNTEVDAGNSPLSRTVKCEGQELHIDIYQDDEGRWLLTVTNQRGDQNIWSDSFRTERSALRAALKAIRGEGLEGFTMEHPYLDELH